MMEIRCKQEYIEAIVEHLTGRAINDSGETCREHGDAIYRTKTATDKTGKDWLKKHMNS